MKITADGIAPYYWTVKFDTHAESVMNRGNFGNLDYLSTEDELSDFIKVYEGALWVVTVTRQSVCTIVSLEKPKFEYGYLVVKNTNGKLHYIPTLPTDKDKQPHITVEEYGIDILRKRVTPVPVPFDNDIPVEFRYKALIRGKSEGGAKHGNGVCGILHGKAAAELEQRLESDYSD